MVNFDHVYIYMSHCISMHVLYLFICFCFGVWSLFWQMFIEYLLCVVVCCYSVAKSCPTLCNLIDNSTTSFPVLHYLPSLLRFMSIELVMLLTIASYAIPFFCLQSFLISQSFPMSQLFQGGQSIRVSASATVLPMIFRVDFL